MIPLYDFNVVYCAALATVSAAVGYGYSRRRSEQAFSASRPFSMLSRKHLFRKDSSSMSETSADSPMVLECDVSECASDYSITPSDTPAEITESGSLKRKTRDEDIENFTHENNMSAESPSRRSSSPPRKRCRTPSDIDTQTKGSIAAEESILAVSDAAACRVDATLSARRTEDATASHDSTPQPQAPAIQPLTGPVTSSPRAPASSPLPSSFVIPVCKPSSAFSAFAGASSGFGSTFTSAVGPQRPVWCAGKGLEDASSTLRAAGTSLTQDAKIEQDTVLAGNIEASSTPAKASAPDALAAYVPAMLTASTHAGVTGEEEEEVQAELKGVKLFVKRGSKEFSSGMLGHLKLLSDRDTKEERLVFRREPVWKVSMSVRLRPTVRAKFDEEQGVLRITLREAADPGGRSDDTASEAAQVVVYALTKGKCTKADFAQFARSIAGSSQFGPAPAQVALS